MHALLLIDLQVDFCPGGAMAVTEGDHVIPIANAAMKDFELVVATQDWHPADHGSFAANHPWRYPGQVIELHGLQQVLWPIHCVQESWGAEFHPRLDLTGIDRVFQKGMDKTVDSYSGFFDNGRRQSTGLHDFLQAQGVTAVTIMGLATDYCVKYTALDAASLGYTTTVVREGCRAVNLDPQDEEKAYQEMIAAGITVR